MLHPIAATLLLLALATAHAQEWTGPLPPADAPDAQKASPGGSLAWIGRIEGLARPTRLAASPDGRWVAVASGRKLAVHDARTGAPTGRVEDQPADVAILAFSPTSTRLVAARVDGVVAVFRVPDGSLERELARHDGWHSGGSSAAVAVEMSPSNLAISSDGTRLFSGNPDGTISRWDLEGGLEEVHRFGAEGPVAAIALDPADQWLAASVKGKVFVVPAGGGAVLRSFEGGFLPVTHLAVSHDGAWIALDDIQVSEVRVHASATGKRTAKLEPRRTGGGDGSRGFGLSGDFEWADDGHLFPAIFARGGWLLSEWNTRGDPVDSIPLPGEARDLDVQERRIWVAAGDEVRLYGRLR